MFHFFHVLLFPIFVVLHVLGFIFVAFMAMVLLKAFRRRSGMSCARRQNAELLGSGNAAFADYRRATLNKLELEAEEFRKYLDGLRRAADASAFEAFLRSRRAEGGPAA